MNEKEPMGNERLEEAFRRHDTLYLQKYPPARLPVSKRLLTVLLAATLLICSTLVISAAKESLSEFAVKIYQEFIEFFFEGASVEDSAYSPSTLPEGYTLFKEYEGNGEYKRIWRHTNGDLIMLSQLPFDAKITIDCEDTLSKKETLYGISIISFEKYDKRIYYWYSETAVFTLTVPVALSDEDAFILIRSLTSEK